MARRERIYQGEIEGPAGERLIGELWSNGSIAIVFRAPHNEQVALLTEPSIGMAGEGNDARLAVTGKNEDGETETWMARPPERVILNLVGQKVRWEGGAVIEGATVQQTQYRVTVKKAGQDPQEFVGATITESFGKRAILTAEGERIALESKGGCGCGG